MNAPLNRDQQIELMKTAKVRHEAGLRKHLAEPVVRDLLRRPAPGQTAGGYARHNVKVACCG